MIARMGGHLVPCSCCDRHVRVADSLCPFCGAPLPDELRARPAPPVVSARIGRAAVMAFGILAASGCGAADKTPPPATPPVVQPSPSPPGPIVQPTPVQPQPTPTPPPDEPGEPVAAYGSPPAPAYGGPP